MNILSSLSVCGGLLTGLIGGQEERSTSSPFLPSSELAEEQRRLIMGVVSAISSPSSKPRVKREGPNLVVTTQEFPSTPNPLLSRSMSSYPQMSLNISNRIDSRQFSNIYGLSRDAGLTSMFTPARQMQYFQMGGTPTLFSSRLSGGNRGLVNITTA